jgi:Xaa-Pro aminopeptidase
VLFEAQNAAVAAVRPSITCEAVDAAARHVIADAGYGDAFLHRTGHGIGMDGHEDPYIVAGNALPLEPGMAFSIEPGIYLAGHHGSRIEDIVVCTEDGVRRLNNRPTDLAYL